MDKQQYVLVSVEHGIEAVTNKISGRGLTIKCTQGHVAGYAVGYELNHDAFPPEYEGDCYYRLDLVMAPDGMHINTPLSIRKDRLLTLGYRGL